MMNSSLRRVIATAAPLWAGEAELVRTYWSAPKRSAETDLLWLKRQCFKEFWGSGVGKYDRGGVVPAADPSSSPSTSRLAWSWSLPSSRSLAPEVTLREPL